MPRTILHFANMRLGTTCAALGTHGHEHRAQMLATLASITDLACAERVDAALISGDLFDCSVPAPKTLDTVRAFFASLQRAAIPVIVLPGARDPEGIFDPECQPHEYDLCPGALILGPAQPLVRLDALNLVIRAVTLPPPPPTEGVALLPRRLDDDEAMVIGLAYRPGSAHDLAGLGRGLADGDMRYLGVGGDTAFADHTEGNLTLCCPGVPEPLDWGQEHGSVALIRIDDRGKLLVDRRRTGTHSFVRRELEVTPENARTVTSLIEQMAHPTLAMEMVLTGQCPFDVLLNPMAIEAELSPAFFHLRLVDRTKLLLTDNALSSLPQGTIPGNFARVMDGRLRDAADEYHAAFDREAYQLGLSLLQGSSPAE